MTERIAGLRGRRPSPPTPELHLRRFAAKASPPPPSGDVTNGITDYGMLGNDRYGDCGPAATEHYRMTKAGSVDVSPAATDSYTESLYFAYGTAQGEPGSQPDEGVDNASWLKWLFDRGLILAYARLDASDRDEVCMAMLNFHGVLIGCSLTDDAEDEFNNEQPWNITAQDQPDPNEGHDVLLAKYDGASETVVTWGALQAATIAWETGEAHSGDLEAWVIITEEDAARNGVDLAALQAQITAWGGEVTPTPAPAPVPDPAPPTPAPDPVPSPPDPQPPPPPPPDPEPGTITELLRAIHHIWSQATKAVERLIDDFEGK